jgi:hypothetical protein
MKPFLPVNQIQLFLSMSRIKTCMRSRRPFPFTLNESNSPERTGKASKDMQKERTRRHQFELGGNIVRPTRIRKKR